VTRLRSTTRATFISLRNRNYRLYFLGQVISVSGTWMQGVAQAWLVLQLSGSGTLLGLVTALQFLPILVAGPLAGVVADRVDKRRLLLVTQSIAGMLALTLGLLTVTGAVQLWMVFVLAFLFGCVVALDNPARQSFVLEMVGSTDLSNAVTLNSVVVNAARIVGPAVAGLLIAGFSLAACFFINAGSYLAVLTALYRMRPDDLRRPDRAPRGKGQLREGLRYVRATPELRVPLVVMAVVGTLAYEFQVILPLLARFTFDGGAGVYGAMSSMMGVGAVIGGLATARRSNPTTTTLMRAALVFGFVILGVAVAPTLPVALIALMFTGAASIVFMATANATLQLRAAPEMRGRVMALWAVAFLGTTPIGGPIVGWVGETFGPRWGLGLGAVAAISAGLWAAHALGQRPLATPVTAINAQEAADLGAAAGTGGGAPNPSVRVRALDVARRASARGLVRRASARGVVRRARARDAARGEDWTGPAVFHPGLESRRRRTRVRARR
jgi:MFS family permease